MNYFTKKLYRLNHKKNSLLLVSMTILTSIELTFMELSFQESLGQINLDMIFKSLLAMVILFAFVLTFYINSYELENHKHELAILAISGESHIKLFKYIFQLFGRPFILSIPLGIILSCLLLAALYLLLNSLFHLHLPLFSYSMLSILAIFALITTKLIYIVVLNMGFIYRHEIVQLLNPFQKKEKTYVRLTPKTVMMMQMTAYSSGKDQIEARRAMIGAAKREIKKNTNKWCLLFPIFYFISLGLLMLETGFTIKLYQISILLIHVIVLELLVFSFFNRFYDAYHSFFLRRRELMNSYHHFLTLLESSNMILLAFLFMIPIMIYMLSLRLESFVYQFIGLFAYGCLLVMLAMCIYFKNKTYVSIKVKDVLAYHMMGYSLKEIRQVFINSLNMYYGVLVLLPLFTFGCMLLKAYFLKKIHLYSVIFIIVFYLFVFIVIYLKTRIDYVKAIKGVTMYE